MVCLGIGFDSKLQIGAIYAHIEACGWTYRTLCHRYYRLRNRDWKWAV